MTSSPSASGGGDRRDVFDGTSGVLIGLAGIAPLLVALAFLLIGCSSPDASPRPHAPAEETADDAPADDGANVTGDASRESPEAERQGSSPDVSRPEGDEESAGSAASAEPDATGGDRAAGDVASGGKRDGETEPSPGAGSATTSAGASGAASSAKRRLSPPGAGEAVKVFPMLEDEWRMWGGNPGRNMVNPFAENIPAEWDIETGKNIKWTAALGSQAYGNPVIADGKILVGTNNDRQRNPEIQGDKGVIMCFREADGEFLWQMVHDKLSAGRVNDWPEQGICSTPVIQEGRFWYVSNRCEVVCADLDALADGNDGPYEDEKYTSSIDGDIIWVYDMMGELGVFPHNLATSSPLVVNDIVFVLTSNGVERDHITIPSPRSPSFIALDKNTGELLWESADPGENILHGQWSCASYGVAGGRPQVVFPGGDGWLYSYEPRSGDLIWKFDLNPKDSKWELGGLGTRNNLLATPVFYDDTVFLAVGQDPEHGDGIGHLYAIRADGQGDVTGKKEVWHYGGEDFRRTMSTVAVHEGLIYAADLSGFLHCLDQKTGKPYWIHDMLAAVWSSPTVIDGKVFLGDEDGDVVVLATGKEKKLLSEQNMHNSVYSTPVAAKGVLYIGNRTRLFAIQEGAQGPAAAQN